VKAWIDPEGYRRFSPAKPAFEEEVDRELGAPKLGRTDAPVEFSHRYRLAYSTAWPPASLLTTTGKGRSSQTTRLKGLTAEKIVLQLND
jgi:hypothetical protein